MSNEKSHVQFKKHHVFAFWLRSCYPSMAEQIRKNLEEDVAHKESILKNLQKLKSRQVEVNEKIENRKKEKEKPVVTELKSFTLGANKKPASILDRLGPKETKDPVQKVRRSVF